MEDTYKQPYPAQEQPKPVKVPSGEYRCFRCGAEAMYDGRCGDGPVLLCSCRNIPDPWDDYAPRR